jgi:hypothetical protein
MQLASLGEVALLVTESDSNSSQLVKKILVSIEIKEA